MNNIETSSTVTSESTKAARNTLSDSAVLQVDVPSGARRLRSVGFLPFFVLSDVIPFILINVVSVACKSPHDH